MSIPMPNVRSPRDVPAAAQGDASERIALEIRHYLARHDLRPGDRLGTEAELAAEFGVSRPTLREALRLLSSSQLVRSTRGAGGGIFVASTPNEGISRSLSDSIAALLSTKSVSLRQLVEARMHLEIPLAGLAAANATPETVLKLVAAIDEANGHDPAAERFRLADACFHRTIAATAGNELLSAFTSWTLDVLQPSLVAAVGDAIDGELILAQHREILRAVRRHQPAAAERAMRRHLEYLVQLVKALEECPDA
jgi:GntR family transcriptional regulator, transcriptional repressor for pyruvate dehydrogenase complex